MSKYFTLILILISIFTIGCEKQQTGKMANILGVTDEPVVTEITDEPTEEPVEEPPVDEPEVEPPPIVFEPEVEPILEGVLPTDNVVRVDELPEDITIFETIDELYAHEDVKAWFKEAEEWISGVCKGELNPFEKRPQTYFYFTTREVRNSFEKSYPGKAEGKKLYCHRFFRPHPKGRLCYN
ncbi:MAG: hypothetical protein OXM61_07035, partial [Candidatus Poribacteria bacterium]|nr:hypothetical protein [Candidatus Poribacteria bacterium]